MTGQGTLRPLQKIGMGVLAVLIALLIVLPLLFFLIPALPFLALTSLIARWRFYRKNRGRWLLVASRRMGWYEFVLNNVVPVLPQDMSLAWHRRASRVRPVEKAHEVMRYLGNRAYGQTKPYLVAVRDRSLEIVPVHADLLPLKRRSAADTSIQAVVANLLMVRKTAGSSGMRRTAGAERRGRSRGSDRARRR